MQQVDHNYSAEDCSIICLDSWQFCHQNSQTGQRLFLYLRVRPFLAFLCLKLTKSTDRLRLTFSCECRRVCAYVRRREKERSDQISAVVWQPVPTDWVSLSLSSDIQTIVGQNGRQKVVDLEVSLLANEISPFHSIYTMHCGPVVSLINVLLLAVSVWMCVYVCDRSAIGRKHNSMCGSLYIDHFST